MHTLRRVLLTCAFIPLVAAPGFADATLFIGGTTTPTTRPARGVAIGTGLLLLGFEAEYSDSAEHTTDGAPGLRTGMANILVQTPIALAGLRFYVTGGAGVYRERLGGFTETNIGFNTGGGVKIGLLGPLGARFDYRVFNLRGSPVDRTVHRLYAGLNLGF
jgi:hypothetical protein